MTLPKKISILLVDDRPENLISSAALLEHPEYNLIKATSGQKALKCLMDEDFALILMDVEMPGMDGFETVTLIKQREKTKYIPIIFLTAISKDESYIFKGYGAGAVDYIFKPIDPHILRSKVAVFADLYRKTLMIQKQAELLREGERIKNERELARIELENARREQIAAVEAVRVRDEFFSIASHELKTPLTALKLQVQVLKRFSLQPNFNETWLKKFPKSLESSDRQIDRLIRLVDELLDVAKINNGKLNLEPERLDLAEIVREVYQRLKLDLEQAKCLTEIETQNSIIGYWDRLRVEQVLMNLLSNAKKYGMGKKIRIIASQICDRARLVVQDEGIGIPKTLQSKIFERFERAVAPGEFGGLGLGLYIVKQIIQAHGGTIQVESQLGKGSTFIIEMPLCFLKPSSQIA